MCDFNENYFERGIASGLSLYSNYSWMPELTIRLAYSIIRLLDLQENTTVLDFGSAKGFLVKALRLLYIDAYGFDVSKYAINCSDVEIRNKNRGYFCKSHFDYVISKDVLEHLEYGELQNWLYRFTLLTDKCFHVVPLGDGKTFNVHAYNLDSTHKIAQTVEWWIDIFSKQGWEVKDILYRVKGIKDNYEAYTNGNGFFILEKK